MATKDDKQMLPEAPKHEGVDPLTDGNRYHSEDIKGNSTYESPAEVKAEKASQKKKAKTVAGKKVTEKKADNAASKAAK